MASRKRNAILEDFIEIYKSEPCLWRVKSKEYHDRDKRSVAYGKLISKFKELEPTATKEDVIKKINTLRSNVRREKKKYDESVKSGASSDDIYKPTLWYFELFDFIGDQDVPRSSRSNISDTNENDSNDADNSTENTIDNTTDNAAANAGTGNTDDITIPNKTQLPATRPGRKKTTEQDQLTTDILLSVKDHFKRPAPASAPEDRYDLLGRSIAMKLRSLDKRQRLIAEKLINDTLFDAEMGNLNTEAILNRRSLTSISSPTPSLSRTPSPSPSLAQQYTQPYTDTATVAPHIQPCVSQIQQYNTQQQSYVISSAPQSQPCASPIQQYNTQQQSYVISSAPQSQPCASPIQQFNTQQQSYVISSAPQSQPCASPIQQYNTQQQSYVISSAPQSQPCASPIEQYNTPQQATSPAPQRQPSPALHEEFDTQATTATFYSNFNSELI